MSEVTLNGFTRAQLAELFEYDELFGALRRRKTTSYNAQAGVIAETRDGKGYYHVSINKRFVRVHRIIYFLIHGVVPDEIDHIDNNRRNNTIDNLRAADRKGQAGNTRPGVKNTSGFKGVSKNSRSGMWHAQIKINGKQTYLGRFETKEEAARCYNDAAKAHFGEFAKLNEVAT